MHEYTEKLLNQSKTVNAFKPDNYTENLLQQFQNAYGIHLNNINDLFTPTFFNSFDRWLIDREQAGTEYISLLDRLGLDFDSVNCIEFGKGQCDSVVKMCNTRIITPYTEGLEHFNKRVLKIDNYYAINGLFTIVTNDHYYVITGKKVMTQNVYSESELLGWESIHNYGDDIIVGAYGSVYDRDKEQKINELKKIKDKLEKRYIEKYDVNGDTYCYVVASKTKKRKKIK